MSLEHFLDEVQDARRSLVVVNRSAPQSIQTMLESAFADQPVSVDEEDIPDSSSNLVLLVDESADGNEVIATSPLQALQDTILLVNSDLYKTGSVSLAEFELPDVLERLDDVRFRLRGYPESNTEKLLLIAISRYIERRAWQMGTGTLRTSFQRLSRINDERGTRAVYDKLADSAVQTHIYGLPDWQHPLEFDVVAHSGYTGDFRDSWFVVYTPEGDERLPGDDTEPHAALLALEVSPREWEGFWTYRPSLVADIDEYIAHNL